MVSLIEWYVVIMLLAAPVAGYWDEISPNLNFWYFYLMFAKWISLGFIVLSIITNITKYT